MSLTHTLGHTLAQQEAFSAVASTLPPAAGSAKRGGVGEREGVADSAAGARRELERQSRPLEITEREASKASAAGGEVKVKQATPLSKAGTSLSKAGSDMQVSGRRQGTEEGVLEWYLLDAAPPQVNL